MAKLTIVTFPQMLESLEINSIYRIISPRRNWALHYLVFRMLETKFEADLHEVGINFFRAHSYKDEEKKTSVAIYIYLISVKSFRASRLVITLSVIKILCTAVLC